MYVSLVASHRDPEWYRSAHMEFGGHSAFVVMPHHHTVDSLTKWLKLSADSLVLIQNVFNHIILALYIIYAPCPVGVSLFQDGRHYNHILPVVRTGSVTCNGNEPNIAHCKLSSCSSDCNAYVSDIGIKCDYSKRYHVLTG